MVTRPGGGARSTAEGFFTASLMPHLPALLVLAFGVGLGTFPGAAGGWQSCLGHGVMLAVLGSVLPALPWRRQLPVAVMWTLVAVSWWLSPVPRAGVSALAMLPAYGALPFLVAHCWWRPEARTAGLRSLALTFAAVASWSLVSWRLDGTPRAAMPLGHHNLLAAWLVILLPLVVVPWRRVGWPLAGLAGVLGAAALLATGSLAGAAAAAASLLAMTLWRLARGRRARPVLVGAAVLGVLMLLTLAVGPQRLRGVVTGRDASLLARGAYAEAAWSGFLERPVVGWGPGAAHWTLAEHLRPRPGLLPAGQVVADVHNLPLQLLYELGLLGVCGLGVAAFALLLRGVPSGDPQLAAAAVASLVAGSVVSLGGMDLSVTALPAVFMVAVGALLASGRESGARQGPPAPVPVSRRVLAAVLVLALAAWQLPRDLGHLAYDRALLAEAAGPRRAALARAVQIDPALPLYRWRLALLEADPRGALAAARQARGVAVLWLVAGELGAVAGDGEQAAEAWVKACDLDPLGAVAPFRLAAGGPGPGRRLEAERAARALLAAPSLLAATGWPRPVVDAAVERLREERGIDGVWRRALEEARRAAFSTEPSGASRRLGLRVDSVAGESMSLFVFRRRPWPVVASAIELSSSRLSAFALQPAEGAIRDGAILAPGCRLGGGRAIPP